MYRPKPSRHVGGERGEKERTKYDDDDDDDHRTHRPYRDALDLYVHTATESMHMHFVLMIKTYFLPPLPTHTKHHPSLHTYLPPTYIHTPTSYK